MHQFWHTASWLPPTCGFSAILIGTLYPLGDYLRGEHRMERSTRDLSSVVRCFGGFIGVNYAASKLPWMSGMQTTFTLALISIGLWFWFDRTLHGFMLSFTVALVGTMVAYVLVLNGWYSLNHLATMTTIVANDARNTGSVDADELFMKFSVPELNVYERRTRQDIENKKQELRMMVGERYRDLIGAADCIVRMKETAFAVQDNIVRMKDSCDIHALKRSVAAKTKKAQGGAMDDMKKSLYTSAAQIKLLADAPEQIWKNMENSSYLTASRLFLISKAIYKNLNAGMDVEESQSVKVMETFPVVGRQWDAVSHFKAQILQKSHHHLKSAKESDVDVIETICAIMLLEDATIKDMFRRFLAQRQTVIRETLESKSEDIGGQIVKAISILQATLFHVGHIFLVPDQGKVSPLERYLRNLQQTFSAPSNTTSMPTSFKDDILAPNLTASVIPKLYPTTPNIHLLVRYLPESVQNFTPFIHLEGARATFTQQDALQGIRLWMEDTQAMFSSEFERLLQQVHTSTALVTIRSSVWTVLQRDEYALVSKAKNNPFNEICRELLGEPVSIWHTILRSGFSKTFQDIIVYSLDELSHQPEKLLRPRLGELDQEDDPNHDIGKFIWNDAAIIKGAGLPSATEPLVQKIREYVSGKTDLVAQTTGAFDDKLNAIRSDQEQVLACQKPSLDGAEDEDLDRYESLDLFGAKADTQDLVEYYQRYCVECIKAYTSGLEQLVTEAVQKSEKARNTIQALDRAMTVGRVALGIASMGLTIQRSLLPPRDRTSTLTFAKSRAAKSNVEGQVQGLVSGLHKVYLFSHDAWIESLEWKLNRSIKHYLMSSSWTDLATLAWEPIPSEGSASPSVSRNSPIMSVTASTTATMGEDAKTLLPFHCSTRLITALHQSVQDLHRAGTGLMRSELIQALAVKLGLIVLRAIDQFLTDVADQIPNNSENTQIVITEKGALQLLFDVKFVNLVFLSSLDKDSNLSRLSKSVVGRIREHIDPINLAVFERPLDINAERQYGRVTVLLGLLVQLNPVDSSKRKVNTTEKSPHVFAMAPLCPRFVLLPIGQKMPGRVL
ncbi:Golgi transport complex subunit 1 [Mortierella sp. AM989]|nr:Golgi transport complex subunit 1 [Mortierella sp. AM989]